MTMHSPGGVTCWWKQGQLSRMFRLDDTREWPNGWVSTEDQAGFIDCHGTAPRNCGKGVDDGQVR